MLSLAILPVLALWSALLSVPAGLVTRLIVYSLLAAPSYALFALTLMLVSPIVSRVTGERTPPNAEMPLADMGWPLLRWARYMVATHVVRLVAGSLFRSSPLWTAYLRWNGATVGRRVYVNTLAISDHNLLELGDDVVIGGDVHISGHTVEHGVVKTAGVRLAHNVTVGLGTVIDIGVTVGPGCQIGALSLVPKHATLEAESMYVGVPARRIQ